MAPLAIGLTCLACFGNALADYSLGDARARLAMAMSQGSIKRQATPHNDPSDLALMLLSAALKIPTRTPSRGLLATVMKQAAPVAQPESTESIFEFDDGKHAQPLLGVVKEIIKKSKKSKEDVYFVEDEDAKSHRVTSKHIHCVFPPNRKLQTSVSSAEKLKDYTEIAKLKPGDLGVDIEVLEMAWETLAGEDELSIEAIMNEIDPTMCESPIGKYRAFRILSSDLGQLFFQRLHSHDYHHIEFKPKSQASVISAKQKWCEDAQDAEWCSIR